MPCFVFFWTGGSSIWTVLKSCQQAFFISYIQSRQVYLLIQWTRTSLNIWGTDCSAIGDIHFDGSEHKRCSWGCILVSVEFEIKKTRCKIFVMRDPFDEFSSHLVLMMIILARLPILLAAYGTTASCWKLTWDSENAFSSHSCELWRDRNRS